MVLTKKRGRRRRTLLPVAAILALSAGAAAFLFPGEQLQADHIYAAGEAIQQGEVQEELDLIGRELDTLSENLDEAIEAIDTGREMIEGVWEDLQRLEEDLKELGDAPGALILQTKVLELRKDAMEASLKRALANMPEVREMLRPDLWSELEWREMPPGVETMRSGSIRRDIFQIGEDVEIGLFDKVRGDVVVIGGKITVRGSVSGSAISIFDDIYVTSTGRVDGDAVTIGGTIRQDAGGTIRGNYIDTHGFWPSNWMLGGFHRGTFFFVSLALFVLLLTISVVTGLIAPKNVDRVELQVRKKFGVSFLVGLATEFLLPVAIFLLAITIIGIPVAFILIPLVLLGLLLLGFTGVAKAVGRGADQRGLRMGESPLALIAVGVILLEAINLIGHAVGIASDLFTPVALATRFVGILILFVAWTTGLGAALMTRFGTRTPGEVVDTAPKTAPPPVGAEITS